MAGEASESGEGRINDEVSVAAGAVSSIKIIFSSGKCKGLLLHSFDAFLIGDLVGSTAFWAIFKAADVKVPKNLKGICKLQHSPEELEEWLKQYPCYDSNDNEF